jgi:hypothetical protein
MQRVTTLTIQWPPVKDCEQETVKRIEHKIESYVRKLLIAHYSYIVGEPEVKIQKAD